MVVCTDNNSTPTTTQGGYSISSSIITSSNISSGNHRSSLTKLSSGKRKLINTARNINPVPMVDLTSEVESDVHFIEKDPFKGISKDYLDHGEQNVICGICKARLWKDEAGKGKIELDKLCYLQCCGYGKVELPDFKDSQSSYQCLFRCMDEKSKHFLKNIRRFNSMFTFTSMGRKIDSSINKGNAPYIFRLGGQNYHSMGSLLPENGEKPKFAQLYIYHTDNEVSNRQTLFSQSRNRSTSTSETLDTEIIQYLKIMLDTNNQLVKTYRSVRDCLKVNPHVNLKLRLIGKREKDGRIYNLPTASEVAALIVGDITDSLEKRDIIVETQTGDLQRISELHPSYLALQYPLLFPYGDDCYRVDIPHRELSTSSTSKRPNCTMREWFAYRVQDRDNNFSLILNSRRLFQQFLVDAYTMIETESLNFIRYQQKDLRCESYDTLQNLQKEGKQDISKVGQQVILPSSFTGGARYMMQNYLDAMSLCKWYGYPDFFITITCNPKWPEVKRFLKDTTINPEDRPDILCRIFKIKLDSIITDLKEKALLGTVQAVVYTVEF
ncbi:uncharacterized protein LOC110931193 [Helianthus annuus]|uniref:uncharacterized protein LOC110931193 n=1 Tax=Helianthus annuus TaxID=4232 RepID=UPI000B8FF633|nr:uncharacterized protein LOC110931193 [Helianthus annuus]